MKYVHEGKVVDVEVSVSEAWVIGCIALHIKKDGVIIDGFDIPVNEAESLYFQLGAAIQHCDYMDDLCKRADEYSEILDLIQNWGPMPC